MKLDPNAIDAACEAMAICVARQDGVLLTSAGYRHAAKKRPADQKEMVEYVEAAISAYLEKASTTFSKYRNRADGKIYELISEDDGVVSYALHRAGAPHYLGRSEFVKRFEALPLPTTVTIVSGWQPMETAPLDGKHCILAVKEGAFFYAVQGVHRNGEWDAVHRSNVKPLCWMPNIRIPTEFLSATATEGE